MFKELGARLLLVGMACCLSATAQAQTLKESITQAQQAVAAGKVAEAFAALQALEPEHAGTPEFDYWYGVIALRAEADSEAIIALQRVVAVNPKHAGAHMELIGAHLRQNNLQQAEYHLTQAKALQPPERAQAMISRYEEVLAERKLQAEQGVSLVVLSTDVGYDSNYVNYPDSFDLFQGTFLEGIAILAADETAFTTLRGSYYRKKPLSDKRFIEVTASGQARMNEASGASAFNTNILQVAALLGEPLSDSQELKYGLEASKIWLDEESFRSHLGLQLSYQHKLSDRDNLGASLRVRDFQFKNGRNDYRSLLADVEWSHQVNANLSTRLRLANELERANATPARPGGDATRLYLSADVDYQLNGRSKVSTGIIYGRLRYHNPGFAIFNLGQDETRRDDLISLRGEWQYSLNRHWQMALSGQYREQNSRIDFFDLDQKLVQWTVTYAF